MQPKLVVLGSAGMLGHKVFQRLQHEFSSTTGLQRAATSRLAPCGNITTGIDAADFDCLAEHLKQIRPDYIINCVGIIKQRPEAQDPIPAITINALLPHRLAALAATWNGRLIHFSTDCVFSGLRGKYREDDPSDAQDLYGRSKFLGEVRSANGLTLRTSIIGRELAGRRSLLEWFRSQNGGRVRGYRRVMWSGVTTNHAAELVARIIRQHSDLCGLYQVASEPISKLELLLLLKKAYSLDVQIIPDEAEQSDRSMLGEKLRAAIGYVAPAWPDLIRELASDPTPYESWAV